MSYKVTAVGPDWVEVWDGVSIIDPDTPRHKSTERIFVGDGHVFQMNDVVALMVRLVARITPPGEESPTTEQILEAFREDRQVLNNHG